MTQMHKEDVLNGKRFLIKKSSTARKKIHLKPSAYFGLIHREVKYWSKILFNDSKAMSIPDLSR